MHGLPASTAAPGDGLLPSPIRTSPPSRSARSSHSPSCSPTAKDPALPRSTCRSACPSKRAPRIERQSGWRPLLGARRLRRSRRRRTGRAHALPSCLRHCACNFSRFLQRRPDLLHRVFEVHPEVAFWRMNGSKPLSEPKKIKGKVSQVGIELRARLLVATGVPATIIDITLPRPVARDDWIDALASLVVARRLAHREAISFPSPPETDRLGIPIAIWA